MSTRSAIIYRAQKKWKGIYCHFDGYEEGVGAMLKEFYFDEAKVRELVSLGNISALGPAIGAKHPFCSSQIWETTFYHRDRGDDWESVKPFEATGLGEMIGNFRKMFCENFYIFHGGAWRLIRDSELQELVTQKVAMHS
jgi:hypothetical protein